MKLVNRLLVSFALGIIPASVTAQTASSVNRAASDEVLDRQISNCQGFKGVPIVFNEVTTIPQMMFNLYWCLQTPVGVALLPGDNKSTLYKFKPVSLKARAILDSIVAAEPRYKWSFEDGVINLLPVIQYPPLLDMRIAVFAKAHTWPELMLDDLEQASEVRRRAKELGFVESRFRLWVSIWGHPTHSIQCRGCTVREVLNAIAHKDGIAWRYEEYLYQGGRHYCFGFLTPSNIN